MTTKDLPEDRVALEHLLHSVDRLLAVLEPVRQGVNHASEFAADMLEGDFTESGFFAKAFEQLQQNVAGGFPPHHALTDYLHLGEPSPPPSQVPEQELQRLGLLVRSGTANDSDRERHAVLAGIRIAEYRDAIGALVDRIHGLHRRLVEKLSATVSSPDSVFPQVQPPGGMAGDPGAVDGQTIEGPTSASQAANKSRGRKNTKGREATSRTPSACFDRWAIGLDERKRWQVFQRFSRDWRHHGELPQPPKEGREWVILKAFADEGGTISRVDLIRLFQPRFSEKEGVQIYNHIVKTSLSRLRTRLRKALGISKSDDPIPWQDEIEGYRLMIDVGYVEKDDQSRAQFRTRDELAT